MDRLEALPYKRSLRYVKVGDIPVLQQNGFLTFTLPGLTQAITAQAVRVEYKVDKQYIWQGKANRTGFMSIVRTQDNLSGFIQLDNKYYVLYPLYEDYCALFEYDLSAMPADSCTLPRLSSSISSVFSTQNSIDYCSEDDNCLSTIDILMLVTPEARNWIGDNGINGFEAMAYLLAGTETVNLAFANSDINANIRTSFAALNNFTFENPFNPFSLDIDVSNLKNHATVNLLRNQYRADLVVLLSDDRYEFYAGGVAAIGPASADAYAIVEMGSLLEPRFTYAHEVGHLFGARHNRSNNCDCDLGDDFEGCQHGWRFNDVNNVERRTLLSFLFLEDMEQGKQKILHYSNPDIDFNGTATGAADDNNAHLIQNTTCLVANFKPSPSFSASIEGLRSWCVPGHPTTDASNDYSAVVMPPLSGYPITPPYTYEWRWNQSGIFTSSNPGILLGTTASITIDQPLSCPFFFLRLKITGSDGQIFTVTRQIATHHCTCDGVGKNILFEQNNIPIFQIFPNPANNYIRLITHELPIGVYQIQLVDILGKIVETRSADSNVLTRIEHTLPTEGLATGIYYLRLVGNDISYSQKIIIHH